MRHVLYLGLAAFVVVGIDAALSSPRPLIAHLAAGARGTLYGQTTTVGVTLLGFVVAAVAILVSFDARRQIVQELQIGESFKLLVLNMLACIALLAVVTVMSLVGAVIDAGGRPVRLYEGFFELFSLWALLELAWSGFWFAVATYKVAAHG